MIVGSLFFEWIDLPYGDTPGGTISLDGWTSLETGDTVFVFVALVIVGLVSRRRLRGPWPLLLGLAATAVVVTFAVSTHARHRVQRRGAGPRLPTPAYDPYDFGPGLFIAASSGRC